MMSPSETAFLRRAAAEFREMAVRDPEIAADLCDLARNLETELAQSARELDEKNIPQALAD